MVAREYANFEPRTKIDVDDFIRQQREAGVELDRRHALAVENALREYERFRYLVEIGEGKQLPAKLLKLEEVLRAAKESIAAVGAEEGYIWEYLLDQSGVDDDCLQDLLTAVSRLNNSINKYNPAQVKARILERLMRRLADIYTEATGRPARISKGKGRRGGRFLEFVNIALAQLPKERWPPDRTISGIGARFERILADDKAGKPIRSDWIGLPYPALARSAWQKNFLRRITGKKP